jgi:hypothetical protein
LLLPGKQQLKDFRVTFWSTHVVGGRDEFPHNFPLQEDVRVSYFVDRLGTSKLNSKTPWGYSEDFQSCDTLDNCKEYFKSRQTVTK